MSEGGVLLQGAHTCLLAHTLHTRGPSPPRACTLSCRLPCTLSCSLSNDAPSQAVQPPSRSRSNTCPKRPPPASPLSHALFPLLLYPAGGPAAPAARPQRARSWWCGTTRCHRCAEGAFIPRCSSYLGLVLPSACLCTACCACACLRPGSIPSCHLLHIACGNNCQHSMAVKCGCHSPSLFTNSPGPPPFLCSQLRARLGGPVVLHSVPA